MILAQNENCKKLEDGDSTNEYAKASGHDEVAGDDLPNTNEEESAQEMSAVQDYDVSPLDPEVAVEGSLNMKTESALGEGAVQKNDPSLSARFDALSKTYAISKRQERRLRRARIVVLICSLGITISVTIMLTKGIKNLVQATNHAVNGIHIGQNLTDQGIALIDGVIARQAAVRNTTLSFLNSSVNGFCPNLVPQVCTNLSIGNPQCNFTGLPFAVELQALVGSFKHETLDSIYATRADLVALSDNLSTVYDQSSSFNWAFIAASVFSILLMVLNWFVAYGIIVAWRQQPKITCLRRILLVLRHWLLVPTFVFFVVMSWIFSMIFIIGSIMTADMCVNSPDDRMVSLLQTAGTFVDPLVLKLLIFYIKGCPVTNIPDELIQQFNNTVQVYRHAVAFADQMANALAISFQATCGTDPNLMKAAATLLEGTLCSLVQTLADVQTYFACENWRPLYSAVAYDSVCYSGNEGFYYISITQFCIVIFAMIMVTLRVAFYSDEEVVLGDEGGHGDEMATANAESRSLPVDTPDQDMSSPEPELLMSPVDAPDQGLSVQEPAQHTRTAVPDSPDEVYT